VIPVAIAAVARLIGIIPVGNPSMSITGVIERVKHIFRRKFAMTVLAFRITISSNDSRFLAVRAG
jgi:hypothetical protein